ncbi:MAG: translation initiation factor [Chitinophagales bacterium]
MAKQKRDKHGFVFSTNPDFKFTAETDAVRETLPPDKQMLKIRFEKKHRGGKEVTIIDEFVGTESDLQLLGKELKTKCGTGGSVKDGQILIQGDHRKKIAELFTKMGYRYKLAGG